MFSKDITCSTSCKLIESKALSGKKCTFLHTTPHAQVREAVHVGSSWASRAPAPHLDVDNLSSVSTSLWFPGFGLRYLPYANSFGRKDAFWHHHFYSQSFTTANLLMFYLFLFELVIKGLTQFIQTPSSKSHYGVVAIVIFHSPNESNWILMTVDSIKQHLIGLLPRNFIFIFSSIMLPKKTQQESYQGLLPSYMDPSLKSWSHFLLFLTSQIFLFHSFNPQDTLNTVSASIEKGKISHL